MKLMTTGSIALLTILIFLGCKQDSPKNAITTENREIKTNISTSGVSNLYKYYHENPQSADQKEENVIIDYIVSTEQEYVRTAEGMYILITKEGSGNNYVYGQDCTADYKGYFLDGKVFDSSYERNQALKFKIGQMNEAWNISLMKVNPGTEYKLICPSRLAYGERGFPGYVPPNTVIAFDIATKP